MTSSQGRQPGSLRARREVVGAFEFMPANQAVGPIETMAQARGRVARRRPASDLVSRNVMVERPDQPWVADFTHVPTWVCFRSLAVVMDVSSRGIVGWAMGHDLKARAG